jgi:hypothetical protein
MPFGMLLAAFYAEEFAANRLFRLLRENRCPSLAGAKN